MYIFHNWYTIQKEEPSYYEDSLYGNSLIVNVWSNWAERQRTFGSFAAAAPKMSQKPAEISLIADSVRCIFKSLSWRRSSWANRLPTAEQNVSGSAWRFRSEPAGSRLNLCVSRGYLQPIFSLRIKSTSVEGSRAAGRVVFALTQIGLNVESPAFKSRRLLWRPWNF